MSAPAGARALAGSRVVAVDVETTGWNADEGDTIVEVAAVAIDGGAVGECWSSLVRFTGSLDAGVIAVHGIDEAMLASAPPAAEVAAQFRERCADHPLAFHNARFDLGFLRPFLRAARARPLTAPVIDTVGLSRGLFGPGASGLGALRQALGIPEAPSHRAAGDALTTARVLIALAPRWERERGVQTLAELAAASQDVVRLGSWRIPGFVIDRQALERTVEHVPALATASPAPAPASQSPATLPRDPAAG